VSNGALSKTQHRSNSVGLILAKKTNSTGRSTIDSKLGSFYFCAHLGYSMNPTLNEMDVLEIEPYGSRAIRAGDVIFFLPPDGGRLTVHRVIKLTGKGLRTKGDNNNHIDPWFLRKEDVVGQVIQATSGNKRRLIYGGFIGLMWSLGIKGPKVTKKSLSFFYHLLARSGFFRRLVPLHKQMRIIALHRKGGRAFKLLLGNWLIGHYQPGMTYWQIRRPFRLFVDVESLPR
jgi:hypothetical protein